MGKESAHNLSDQSAPEGRNIRSLGREPQEDGVSCIFRAPFRGRQMGIKSVSSPMGDWAVFAGTFLRLTPQATILPSAYGGLPSVSPGNGTKKSTSPGCGSALFVEDPVPFTGRSQAGVGVRKRGAPEGRQTNQHQSTIQKNSVAYFSIVSSAMMSSAYSLSPLRGSIVVPSPNPRPRSDKIGA